MTPNEPWIIAWLGYGNGAKAPGIKDAPGTKPYIAGHVLIKAHARAYHIYHNDFYVSQKGKSIKYKTNKFIIIVLRIAPKLRK